MGGGLDTGVQSGICVVCCVTLGQGQPLSVHGAVQKAKTFTRSLSPTWALKGTPVSGHHLLVGF